MTEPGDGEDGRHGERRDMDATPPDRLDRGVKWFYLGTLLLVAFGAISALLRLLG